MSPVGCTRRHNSSSGSNRQCNTQNVVNEGCASRLCTSNGHLHVRLVRATDVIDRARQPRAQRKRQVPLHPLVLQRAERTLVLHSSQPFRGKVCCVASSSVVGLLRGNHVAMVAMPLGCIGVTQKPKSNASVRRNHSAQRPVATCGLEEHVEWHQGPSQACAHIVASIIIACGIIKPTPQVVLVQDKTTVVQWMQHPSQL